MGCGAWYLLAFLELGFWTPFLAGAFLVQTDSLSRNIFTISTVAAKTEVLKLQPEGCVCCGGGGDSCVTLENWGPHLRTAASVQTRKQ